MKKNAVLMLGLILAVSAPALFPCTIFNAVKNGRVLAGNTEDMFATDTKVWFVPGTEGKYGAVYVGFAAYGKQGAMNERGLFFDGNALRYARMKASPEKLSIVDERLVEKIMRECATVEEVIEALGKYNLGGWNDFQIMFADKTGASAVIGPDKNGDMTVTRKKGDYQVSTNFNLASPEFGAYSYPCPRYDIANEMLRNMKELTVDYFRSILAAVHSEGGSPTVYANICDLTNGDIYIYNFHNFDEVARFSLAEELKKGEHDFDIAALFPRKTFAQTSYEEAQSRTLSSILLKVMETEGVPAAVKKFHEIKENFSPVPGELEKLALLLRVKGKVDERIEVYKLYVGEFPKSANGHKKLGDMYLTKGDKTLAVKSYRQALLLEPKNAEVIEILRKLEK